MYGALRPVLRASSQRRPARLIRGRRYPSPLRTRLFHTSRYLSQASTPPVDPDNTPHDNNGARRKRDNDVAEQNDGSVNAEDPELLAQKLQRSRELTRRYSSALRRSQRRGRGSGLPPVIVPDWFVKGRVFLHDDTSPHREPRRSAVTLSLKLRDSDKTSSCSIPLSEPATALQLLTQFVSQAWGGNLTKDQRQRFVQHLANHLGLGDGQYTLQALEYGRLPPSQRRNELERVQARLQTVKQGINEVNVLIQDAGSKLLSKRIPSLDRDTDLHQYPKDTSRVPPFVLAEFHATVAASLSALNPRTSDSFPAAKTNVILHCPSNGHDKRIDSTVKSVARNLGAEVVVLQAQDLAEIAGDYLGDGLDPTPHSIRSLGYETYRLSSELGMFADDAGRDEPSADEQEDVAPVTPFAIDSSRGANRKPPISIMIVPVMKALSNSMKAFQASSTEPAATPNEPPMRTQTQSETQLEEMKIANLLEHLIDATEMKRNQSLLRPDLSNAPHSSTQYIPHTPHLNFFDSSMESTGGEIDLTSVLPSASISKFDLSVTIDSAPTGPKAPSGAKIVYVPDFKELNATHYGGRIIQKLEDIVRKRRSAGESIMIVGATCSRDLTPELSKTGVRELQSEGEASFFRTIFVPVDTKGTSSAPQAASSTGSVGSAVDIPTAEKAKFKSINIRHIKDMLRCLDPTASQSLLGSEHSGSHEGSMPLISRPHLWKRILTYDEVHRIAITTLGLYLIDASCKELNSNHIALALSLLQASDEAKFAHAKRRAERSHLDGDIHQPGQWKESPQHEIDPRTRNATPAQIDRARQMEAVSTTATKHERRLIPGIANPDQIKTTFDQVHVPRETIDSIRTLTSLSFLRPDAFNYGVLASEKISGALLYGPPGTGKTLLAKAVAKESGCAVLEVSGSQIMDKYVGEGEKNVTAVFSLARKLSPCIVFLDEADAIFSSRDTSRERTSHRDILNQFLKEWDGLNDLSVFVMVATNRPFDLDDAVIRRLPRRLLVDLPTQADRKEILRIHLAGEQLDESVDLEDIAKRTPFYSGSDLKNVAVSAALACVKEENEQAAISAVKKMNGTSPESTESPPQLQFGHQYMFPEKRVLHARHFDRALQEISASISEDMKSLNAIKKFDEKYGDKKGRKQKRMFGIGIDMGTDESAARVRK